MIMLYRILFICLALLGAFVLIKVIPVITKLATEKPVMMLPLTQDGGTFEIIMPGEYSVWQKGNGLRRTRIDIAPPAITDASSGRSVMLSRTSGMITANDGSGTRRQLFTFSAPTPGTYRIKLPAAATVNDIYAAFSLEIRKPMPVFRLVLSILVIIAGFAMLIGSIVGIMLAGRQGSF